MAISGKGGVGKTTLASSIGRLLGRKGKKVVLIDCDPAPNLAISLGIPEEARKGIEPLCQLSDLIAERTGVRPGESKGKMYKINPEVDDLLDRFGVLGKDNVTLLVLGTIRTGGGGCFCPESSLMRRLLGHLVRKEEILIMDMEAGVEHLGRGTIKRIDLLLVVVEPGQRSIETARAIVKLAKDLGIGKIKAVLNKCGDRKQKKLIERRLSDLDIELIGTISFSKSVMTSDLDGVSVLDTEGNEEFTEEIDRLIERLPIQNSLS